MLTAIIGIIIGLILGCLVTLLVEQVRFKLELDRIYLAPFMKWCADFYGELDEFWARYLSSKVNRNDYSNVQIIDDWRALHEVVIDGSKWLAKVKKENEEQNEQGTKGEKGEGDEKIGKFSKLLRIIDRLWHQSEDKYDVKLKDRFDVIGLDKDTREKMANDLWDAKDSISREISVKDKKTILTYLRKQTP